MTARLRILQSVIGGDLTGRTLVSSTIGHGPGDRGTSYTDAPGAPDGLLVYVHNGNGTNDALAAKDRALQILGEETTFSRRRDAPVDPAEVQRRLDARRRAEERHRADTLRRQRQAQAVCAEGRDPRGTPSETFLHSRHLALFADVAGTALLYHPTCPDGLSTAPATIAPLRCIYTGNIVGVHRTLLTSAGQKIARRMLGTAKNAAVMLDSLGAVTDTLVIGEGIETVLAGRQYYDLKPAWALGSSGAIAAFPVLANVRTLIVIAENDANGASAAAVETVGRRWHAAGRSVEVVWPPEGAKDLNDAVMGGAKECA